MNNSSTNRNTAAPQTSHLLRDDPLAFATATATTATTAQSYPSSGVVGHHSGNPPSSSSSSSSSKCPMVEVIAPATLRGGYTFDVEVHRQVYSVTVVSSLSQSF